MKNQRTLTDKVFLFLKGMLMGGANKVPGVSGGMVSFVFGFYEEMIYSFQKINGKAFRLLLNGRFKSFYNYLNGTFLLLVFSGSICSYFSVSLGLDYLIKHYELYVWSSFFGMILGSVYYLVNNFKGWNNKSVLFMLLGAIVGLMISFMSPATENDNLWFVFFCGIISVSGMTLPGLSGSFILILLGNYVLLLVDSVTMLYTTIIDVFSGDFSFLQDAIRIRYLKIMAVFTGGSAVGLISLSHILGYVLKRWHDIVIATIIGFIIGSLGIVWPWKKEIYKVANGKVLIDSKGNYIIEDFQRYLPDFMTSETWIAIIFIIFGAGLVYLIDIYGKKREKQN
ncbi:MAG: DUF368 domain-containing protein [Flavobacteriaceae bacterium]|nr:DUF368 domain-containing protein [Flavobacteriaceae bacterium]